MAGATTALLTPAVPAAAISLPNVSYVDPGWNASTPGCATGSTLDLALPAAGQDGDIRIAFVSAAVQHGTDPGIPADTLGTNYTLRINEASSYGPARSMLAFTSETGPQAATTLSFPCLGTGIPMTMTVVIGRPAPGHRAVFDAASGRTHNKQWRARTSVVVNHPRELVVAAAYAVGATFPVTAERIGWPNYPFQWDHPRVDWDRDVINTTPTTSVTVFANGHGTTWGANGRAGITLYSKVTKADWAVATVSIGQV